MEKEDYAVVLDYLPYGYPLEGKPIPLAQAVGIKNFVLLQLIPRKGISLQQKEKVYIGEGKRDKIYYISGRLDGGKLTESAKMVLQEFVSNSIDEREKEFVEFFNNADAINTRMHQLELLPGFGKKHTKEILEERKKKKFESFQEIKQRVSSIPDPKKSVEKRIIEEISGDERHRLFAQ